MDLKRRVNGNSHCLSPKPRLALLDCGKWDPSKRSICWLSEIVRTQKPFCVATQGESHGPPTVMCCHDSDVWACQCFSAKTTGRHWPAPARTGCITRLPIASHFFSLRKVICRLAKQSQISTAPFLSLSGGFSRASPSWCSSEVLD